MIVLNVNNFFCQDEWSWYKIKMYFRMTHKYLYNRLLHKRNVCVCESICLPMWGREAEIIVLSRAEVPRLFGLQFGFWLSSLLSGFWPYPPLVLHSNLKPRRSYCISVKCSTLFSTCPHDWMEVWLCRQHSRRWKYAYWSTKKNDY